jgi:mono/diheme cytochrome c family protein
MFRPILLLTALVVLPALTPGPAAAPMPSQDAASPKPSAAMMEKAKKTYAMDCALCHGDNGNGKTDIAKDMALTLDDWTTTAALTGKSDKDLFNIIRNGKDKMPAEPEGRAKDEEVYALIAYIRGFAKPAN